jgi:hypothetical protein
MSTGKLSIEDPEEAKAPVSDSRLVTLMLDVLRTSNKTDSEKVDSRDGVPSQVLSAMISLLLFFRFFLRQAVVEFLNEYRPMTDASASATLSADMLVCFHVFLV